MTATTPTVADEVERYLRTGDTDPRHAAWAGRSFLESAQLARADLENALVAEVSRRWSGWRPPPALVAIEDLAAFTRTKVEPMVRGLFSCAEQDAVMALVERSVVFLTPSNIVEVLREANFMVNSRNYTEKSRGTETFIAEHSRLVEACLRAEQNGEIETAAEGLGLLIDLMREIDRCERDVVFFADEAGSWQVGVVWDRVLPAWFRSLSPKTEAYEWAEEGAGLRQHGSPGTGSVYCFRSHFFWPRTYTHW